MLNVKPLITHRYIIDDALIAYKTLDDKSALGILLNYPCQDDKNLLNNSIILTKKK